MRGSVEAVPSTRPDVWDAISFNEVSLNVKHCTTRAGTLELF